MKFNENCVRVYFGCGKIVWWLH